jgi:hypothetical protein
MYQSRRDVDIMGLQRAMPARTAMALVDTGTLRTMVSTCRCALIADACAFDAGCTVRRDFARDRATCSYHPRTPCHVKEASHAIRRMGDMGKLPTSALLHLREAGGFKGLLADAVARTSDPSARAAWLVARLAAIYRIGIKLASMFVSALSTPELAPGLAPWWPVVDGSRLVVLDANVSRAIDLVARRAPRTYMARSAWFRKHASRIDLSRIDRRWPNSSPRLVQQAVYVFRSRSNRAAYGDACEGRGSPCADCIPTICPFLVQSSAQQESMR